MTDDNNKNKRATRRQQDRRIKQKTVKLAKLFFGKGWDKWSRKDRQHWIGVMANSSRKPCSCTICCNARRNGWNKKYSKLTLQEIKQLNEERDEIKELNEEKNDTNLFGQE